MWSLDTNYCLSVNHQGQDREIGQGRTWSHFEIEVAKGDISPYLPTAPACFGTALI